MKKIQEDSTTKSKIAKSLVMLFCAYAMMFVLVFLFYLINSGYDTTIESITYAGVILILFSGTAYYLFFSDALIVRSLRKCAALSLTMVLNFFLLIVFSRLLNATFIAPFALCSLVVALLMDSKAGFFANFTVILAFFAAQLLFSNVQQFELYYPLFGGVFTSIIASYLTNQNSSRSKYLLVGLQLSIFAVVSTAMCYFMFVTTFVLRDFLIDLCLAFSSGILCVMLMFILVPLFEKMFNLITNFRLTEITSTGQPLLKRLYEEAPGTFNHSLTVANYAEACASAIGANPFLARAAAYYHDIGKLKNPNYFVENQTDGKNPHDELTPEASVVAIKKHVVYGLALAKENHLPYEVQSAILEHHGSMPIKYFYFKAKKYTDGDLPYDDYRYDGPTPTTKINAILMIVDAAEAALRANRNSEDPASIVNDIIEERMNFNQFKDCDLTFHEIDIVKATILTTFLGIKHDRIKYPKAKLINVDKDK